MLSFTVLLLLTLTLLFALTTASTPSRLSTRVPSTPSTPTPSTPVPPHRHTNFHLELERQYSLGLRQRPEQTANVTQRSISQPLDHFDRLNTARYNQTYWVNTQYWDGTGPVFLWLGGEWVEDADTLEYGGNVMGVWAKQFGGAMVNTQHRYYDGRNPPSKEGDTTGLQYLSSQQALADVAAIVAHLNAEWAATHGARGLKWIHVGGSYGGNMAAWYRLKYPNLSVGAFAISGPVQAVVDYTGFFGVEGHDLTPSCLNFTRAAVRQLDALVADSGKGWAQVREDFGVNITSELDAATWGFTLGWDLLGGGSICRQNRSTETPYQTLARVWKSEFSHFNATYDPRNVWQGYSWLWYYQTCTEMTGTDFDRNPLQVVPKFLSPPYFTTACERSYGVRQRDVYTHIDWTNTYYGGSNITTTNTFFSHGNADGWSAAGVTYLDRPVPVYGNSVHIIDKGTHCSDLYFPRASDSASLKAVHAAQLEQIKAWLS